MCKENTRCSSCQSLRVGCDVVLVVCALSSVAGFNRMHLSDVEIAQRLCEILPMWLTISAFVVCASDLLAEFEIRIHLSILY